MTDWSRGRTMYAGVRNLGSVAYQRGRLASALQDAYSDGPTGIPIYDIPNAIGDVLPTNQALELRAQAAALGAMRVTTEIKLDMAKGRLENGLEVRNQNNLTANEEINIRDYATRMHNAVDSDVKCNISRRYCNAWRPIQKEMLPCQDTDI